LKGILTQFDQNTIQEAVGEFLKLEGAYCQKSYKDFDDPGPEVEIGSENRVSLEEIGRLERIIAEPNLLPVHFLEEGAVVQKAVARVTLTESYAGLPAGSGWGTGFLVSPSLFMTNNHVIPNETFARKVEMQFNYQLDYKGNPQTVDAYSPDPDDVFYTNASLDFTLIRLNSYCRWVFGYRLFHCPASEIEDDIYEAMMEYTPNPIGGPRLPIGRPRVSIDPKLLYRWRRWRRICTSPGEIWGYLQLSDSVTYAGPTNGQPGQHINIIQHPSGRRKEVALQRNNITNIYTTRIRYTTDTEPGSSGSPVFNNEWDLIAIHHAAGEWDSTNGVWVNNEGMRIDKIVADLRSHYSGSTTGDQILAELGI
jgi:endonuclease G